MTDLTEARLAEIEARADAATEGPWHEQSADEDGGICIIAGNLGGLVGAALPFPSEVEAGGSARVYANAVFIARARDDVPALVAEVRRVRAENERLREALAYQRDAIAEYYRYWTGGETRGSYDGKPERNALWSAMHKARAALAGDRT